MFYNKMWRRMGLALCAGLLAVGLSAPGWAKMTGFRAGAVAASAPGISQTLGQQVDANLAAARATLLTQGMMPQPMMTYVAILSPQAVVPNAPMSNARGAVGAVLSGNRLVVRASFRGLTSGLRNYQTDPVDPPNPNITSAFHIHRGSPMENGPFQYALEVMLNDMGMGGDARGEFTLTPDQVQALNDGMLYVDLHTTRNRGGELRGILMPG